MAVTIDPQLLVGLVVGGVGLVVLSTHLLGGSALATLDEDGARSRFAEDFPEIRIADVEIARDGHGAILALEDGRVAVVITVGDRFLTRILSEGYVGAVSVVDGILDVRLVDFGAPAIRLALADPAAWKERLG